MQVVHTHSATHPAKCRFIAETRKMPLALVGANVCENSVTALSHGEQNSQALLRTCEGATERAVSSDSLDLRSSFAFRTLRRPGLGCSVIVPDSGTGGRLGVMSCFVPLYHPASTSLLNAPPRSLAPHAPVFGLRKAPYGPSTSLSGSPWPIAFFINAD